MNNGFQNEAAGYLWRKYGAEISELYILFPSRRARLFFNDALAAVATEPVWQPHWMTTDELVAEITGLHTADKVRLITELYKVYAEYHPHETFDKFYFWGEMLLADFDMIDKYMIDAGMLLRNIEQIKELEADVSYLTPEQQRIIAFWGSFGDETSLTEEKRKFLNIWRTLPDIYRRFRERIASLGMAYQGMAYRTAAEMIAAGEACADPSRRYVVAGYNALSQSEKRIFKHIAANSPGTEFLWDYDSWYTDRKEHEAGMFIRENLSLFPPTADISHDSLLRGDKRFESIACASNAIQCKYVADILRSLPPEQLDKRTAIVLTDENLLLPLLYSLPEGLEGINVTMGYPLRQTLVYTFIERLTQLQAHCRRRKDAEAQFYHVDVTGLLAHPYIAECCGSKASELSDWITSNRMISVKASMFEGDTLLSAIFAPADERWSLSAYLLSAVERIVELIAPKAPQAVEYMALAHEEMTKLENTLDECDVDLSAETYVSLLRRHLQNIRIPYEGEPLEGIQVMGILETRNIDFDNVIIMSMTDATFPGDRTSQPSFIPYNLRAAYGLPTPRAPRGRIRLLLLPAGAACQTDIHDVLLASDEKSTGEKSRYIYQLEYESPFEIARRSVGVDVDIEQPQPIVVPKSGRTAETLARYLDPASGYALSPTALFRYVQCPLKFYFASIARLKTTDEVSEQIDALTFGNILHEAMQQLYTPLAGIEHPTERIEALREGAAVESAVDQAIGRIYLQTEKPSKEDYTGNTLLVKDIVCKYIRQGIMRYDAAHPEFTVIGLEEDVALDFGFAEGRTVRLAGRADRIDSLDGGALRIIDYKSGNSPHLEFNGIEKLFEGKAAERISNIFQTLLYSMILSRTRSREAVPTLFYAGRMHREDYSPLLTDHAGGCVVERYSQYADSFEQALRRTLDALFDTEEPFVQCDDADTCRYCDFKNICKR